MKINRFLDKISGKNRKKVQEKTDFPGSVKYWENRYLRGGNSGSGSYNKLADFKASILNDFCVDNSIKKVIEFGCGDGNQLTLARYPQYIGLDIAGKSIEICKKKFKNDRDKQFFLLKNIDLKEERFKGDLSLSLDVIFHLIEDEVYSLYMHNLFNASDKHVIIYSSNYDLEETGAAHVKHRHFTKYVEENFPDFTLTDRIENAYPFDIHSPDNTSFADFYFFVKTK